MHVLRHCLLLFLTSFIPATSYSAQDDVEFIYPSKHPAGLLKSTPAPCRPPGAILKVTVVTDAGPLENASAYLAPMRVSLRKAKAVYTDQGGKLRLCVRKKKKVRLTVIAPDHERYTHVLKLDPKALSEITIELAPVKKGKPDGCEKLGGEWLCSGHICPPWHNTIPRSGEIPFEHCEECCLLRSPNPCQAKRPCPCFCTFSGPFHKASKKIKKQRK